MMVIVWLATLEQPIPELVTVSEYVVVAVVTTSMVWVVSPVLHK